MRLEASVSQFLLNQSIRSRVRPILEKWMFETEVYRAFSTTIIQEPFEKPELDTNVFKLSIKNNYPSLQQSDFNEIDRLIESYIEIDEEDTKHVLNIITEFLKRKTYTRGLQYLSEDDFEKAEEYISKASCLDLSERIATKLSNKTKLTELLEKKFPKDGKYIKSSFGLVNENSTFKGYRRGDLVQVVSPTGRGKTSMMCQEAATLAHQGFKVGYAIIGDNEEDDVAIKVCSYYSRNPILEVVDDLSSYIEDFTEQLDNISCITYPMYSVTVKELLSDFKNVKKSEGLDILFVDYDQNIAMAHEGMYESGGLIYAALKAFAQIEDCVVIVGSQAKTTLWGLEILEADSANESSKKQHNIDIMLTFNWNPECKKVGTMHLAKIRRGNTGALSKIKFNHHISELKEITQEQYDDIIHKEKNKVDLSDKDLRFEEEDDD